MKKIFHYTLSLLALATISFACSKEINDPAGENASNQGINPSKQNTLITVFIGEEGITKVSMDQDSENPDGAVKLAWEEGDEITINDQVFTLLEGAGTKVGRFSGPEPGAAPYTIAYSSIGNTFAEQTQAADGDTGHLGYAVALTGVDDYEEVSFSSEWASAHGGALSESSVLRLRAQLPDGFAAAVTAVTIDADADIFAGGSSLKVNITTPGDTDDDNILNVYASLPAGDVAVPDGTTLMIQFEGIETGHTRVISFDTDILSGSTNSIKINATDIASHAGLKTDDGSAEHPYLIGDKYQLAAVNALMEDNATKYFKLLDDIDMSGIDWSPLNADGETEYVKAVNFNGNGKTISHLGKALFYVFKGSIYDLTLDQCSVTTRGILAEYVQGTGHTITNVNITNGAVNSSDSNVGGMVGRINNGTTGTASVTITDCTVSATNVTGNGVVGGVLGFAEAMVSVSGCNYTGGTVTAAARYVGGFAGSTGNDDSTFTDCQVEDAFINANHTADVRGGGFVGQLQDKVVISGCTVGTPDSKVVINTQEPTKTDDKFNVINVGGFVGVCYGTITKNGDVRSKSYVKITSTNTQGTALKLGGFVGYHSGNIEYCDAIVDMTDLKGQQIGGFAGYVVPGSGVRYGKIDHCTAEGNVTGNNYTAGFAAYVEGGTAPQISNCRASGTVSGQSACSGFVGELKTGNFTNNTTSVNVTCSGSNNGGFAGRIFGGTVTGCTASGDVTATGGGTYGGFAGLVGGSTTIEKCSASGAVTNLFGSYNAGFIGAINNGTVLIRRCFAGGDTSCDRSYAAGFISNINQGNDATLDITIENSYATGSIINSNQMRGGFIAQVLTVNSATISNCYATGAVVGSFRLGGLIGNVGAANISVDHCAAWSSEVTASSFGQGNWSSAAVVGTAFPTCTLTDNYRRPGMPVLAYWGNVDGYTFLLEDDYQHANVDAEHALVKQDGTNSTATSLAKGQDGYPQFPYHGKVEADKTLSQLASTTLGWDSEVWDFSGELPVLR